MYPIPVANSERVQEKLLEDLTAAGIGSEITART
jgi:hypothetical protein